MSNDITIIYYGVIMRESISIVFASNLRKYRKARKLTQQELAELSNIEYKYIQRLEGKKPLSVRIDTLDRLAKALRINSYMLLK